MLATGDPIPGDPIQREVRDHKQTSFLLRIQPYLSRGAINGAVISLVDITDRIRAEARVRDAVERRDQFLAMLSHELRNPLAAILTASEVSERRRGKSDESQVIVRQARQMARLLDDLLDMSRITQGRIDLRHAPVNICSTIQPALDVVQSTADSQNIEISVQVPDEPLWINGDATRLHQIQTNLLKNAVKYTHSGGQVHLSMERDAGSVLLRVSDNGVGMTPEDVNRMFELFVQSDRTLDRSEGGMGVGLTLARSLVELHGGTITAHSAGLGRGSEFTVRLPLIPPPVDLDAPEFDRDSVPCRQVVVVEDNEACLTMMAQLLALDGHEVSMADNGRAGVGIILSKCPDVAFGDIGLPELDGYGVAREVRRQAESDIYLVALSGYGQPSDIEKSRAAGFDEHLVKPIQPDDLLRILEHPFCDSSEVES